MIKYIVFTFIGIITLIVQWLCMNEINGIRAIYNWPSFTAFLAFLNPLSNLADKTKGVQLAVAVISRWIILPFWAGETLERH